MIRSRRFALAAAAVLIGLSACGDAARTATPATTSGKAPVVIHLGSSGAAGANGGAETAAADRMMMPMQEIDFVYDGAFPELAGTGSAWMLPAGVNPDPTVIARLAQVLGVDGDVRELPADQGGGWMVGAADYTTATLTVSPDGMLSWWYNPDPATFDYSGGCAVAEPGVAVDPAVDPAGDTIAGSSGGGTEAAPPDAPTPPVAPAETAPIDTMPVDTRPVEEPCTPQPPANVPDKASALAAAQSLLTELGIDPTSYEFETYADEWGANVNGVLLVDGHRSPLMVSFGFGENGGLTWASGSLATPQPASDYPLVGAAAGLERLNEESGMWMSYGMAYDTLGGAVARTATADIASSETVGAPAPTTDTVLVDPSCDALTPECMEPAVEPVPVDQPVCDPATDCVVETIVPPEPITVHLNGVTSDLTMVWAEDGTVWLLPAYTFTSTDGGMYTVIAVDDSFIDLPDPLPVPEPMPVETVPGDIAPAPGDSVVVEQPAIDPELAARLLVGLPLDEASKVAEEQGWTVRVTTLDGEGQAVTMDLRMDRVNLSVVDGVVTAVDSIG